MAQPLVTILIATRDRPDDLRNTLKDLKRQIYPAIEIVCIDDASIYPLDSLVSEEWPTARCIRNDINLGLIASRSKGMSLAAGTYIISLDDDSSLVESDAISRAVTRMEVEPEIGILAFYIFNGPTLPSILPDRPPEQYVVTFVGCGHMLRRSLVKQIGPYCNFYFYYGEETEYALRVLDRGSRILLLPAVLVHHRVSQRHRSSSRILRFSLRNNVWTVLLRMPLGRAFAGASLKLLSHAVECLRMGQPSALILGLASCIWGLPQIMRLRRPVKAETLRIYDLLRYNSIASYESLYVMSPISQLSLLLKQFRDRSNRPRSRSIWDRRPGDIGQSTDSLFSHQFSAEEKHKNS